MCGPHTSQSSSAASHPTYGPSWLDLASGGFLEVLIVIITYLNKNG